MRAAILAGIALMLVLVAPAAAVQMGPPIPILEYNIDLAAEQAALDAQAGIMAEEAFRYLCTAGIYTGQCVPGTTPVLAPVVAYSPPPPPPTRGDDDFDDALRGRGQYSENQSNCTNAGPGLCVYFAHERLHRNSVLVEGKVRMVPKNHLAAYQAVLHLWRWRENGEPVEVGGAVVLSNPAAVTVTGISGVCRQRTRGRYLFQISGTFITFSRTGPPKVTSRSSGTFGLNC
jgi:hypothetical protein